MPQSTQLPVPQNPHFVRIGRVFASAIGEGLIPANDREVCLAMNMLAGVPFRILFLGSYNAGKSTLINSLIGHALHAVAQTPTTQGFHTCPWQGSCLVDSEGFDAPQARGTMDSWETGPLADQVRKADLIVYCVRPTRLELSATTKEFGRVLASGKDWLFVVNRDEARNPRNQRRQLHSILAKAQLAPRQANDRILFLNAQTALKSAREGAQRSEKTWRRSQCQELVRQLKASAEAYWRAMPEVIQGLLGRLALSAGPGSTVRQEALALEARVLCGLMRGGISRSIAAPISASALLLDAIRARGRQLEFHDGQNLLYCDRLGKAVKPRPKWVLPTFFPKWLLRRVALTGVTLERVDLVKRKGLLILVGSRLGDGCRLTAAGTCEVVAINSETKQGVRGLECYDQSTAKVLGPAQKEAIVACRPSPRPTLRSGRWRLNPVLRIGVRALVVLLVCAGTLWVHQTRRVRDRKSAISRQTSTVVSVGHALAAPPSPAATLPPKMDGPWKAPEPDGRPVRQAGPLPEPSAPKEPPTPVDRPFRLPGPTPEPENHGPGIMDAWRQEVTSDRVPPLHPVIKAATSIKTEWGAPPAPMPAAGGAGGSAPRLMENGKPQAIPKPGIKPTQYPDTPLPWRPS